MRIRGAAIVIPMFAVSALACGEQAERGEVPEPAEEVGSTEFGVGASDEDILAWDAGINTQDLDAILELYDEEPMMMPPFDAAVVGKDAIAGWFEERVFPTGVQVSNRVVSENVAGDWSFNHGVYTAVITPEEGEPIEENGKWTAISRRRDDGKWAMVGNIWNIDVPPSGSPAPVGSDAVPVAEAPVPEAAVCVESLAALDPAFVDAFVAGDVASVATIHAEEGMRMPPGMETISGRGAIASFIQAYVDAFETRDLTVTQTVTQVSEDWGASWGTYEFNYTPADGGEAAAGKGSYVAVGRLGDDGCWRYEWVLWNSDNPPQGFES